MPNGDAGNVGNRIERARRPVKCDAEINPAETRDLGRLYIDIGLAPVKPAEFVIFRLSQMAGGGA